MTTWASPCPGFKLVTESDMIVKRHENNRLINLLVRSMKNLNYYIIAGLLALVLISFGVSHLVQRQMTGGDLRLEIYTNGQLFRTISLPEASAEEIIVTNADGHYNVVEVENGRTRIKEADCPNQMCVKTGWISQPGHIAVCVPNKFNIVIKGKSNKVDTISY